MEESIRYKLKYGFRMAQWGIDICYGALFIAIALIVSAFVKERTNLIEVLPVPFAMCIAGLMVFAVGRVFVGFQSRKLNLHTDRPLTEEERWFVGCMLEVEEKGSGANFLNRAAGMTDSNRDEIAAGTAAAEIIGQFFNVGRRYTGNSVLINRLPAIVSLAAAIIIIIVAIL